MIRIIIQLFVIASWAQGAYSAFAFGAERPVKVFAAGSLSGALPQLISASGLPANRVDKPVFGPAGLLRHLEQFGLLPVINSK